MFVTILIIKIITSLPRDKKHKSMQLALMQPTFTAICSCVVLVFFSNITYIHTYIYNIGAIQTGKPS